MTHRSFTRAHARRQAARTRREALLRRRAGLAAGAAAGAAALFAPGAQAADFQVNTTMDGGTGMCTTDANGCTLRDAIASANGDAAADTITFASTLSGTITLTQGQLEATAGPIAIVGPGAGKLAVSGDADSSGDASTGDTRILEVSGDGTNVTLSGLTLRGGDAQSMNVKYGGGGAAIVRQGATLTVADAALTGNISAQNGGAFVSEGTLTVRNSTLSGNTATGAGGAIRRQKYADNDSDTAPGPLTVTNSVISGNSAASGGGVSFSGTEGAVGPVIGEAKARSAAASAASTISATTVAQNSGGNGGGVSVDATDMGDALGIDQSTISGNPASGDGGGIFVSDSASGGLAISSSTVADNTAGDQGGGLFTADTDASDDPVPVTAEASTLARNTAEDGGGIWLGRVGTTDDAEDTTFVAGRLPLAGTVVAANVADGQPQDLAQDDVDPGGEGVVLSRSLIQTPGAVTTTTDPAAPSILGTDPKLGALADNGGPTRTLLPDAASALLDAAKAPDGVTTDQRGLARTVDLPGVANATGGDGTDIGAVERPAPSTGSTQTGTSNTLPPAPSPPVAVAPPVPRAPIPLPTSRPQKPKSAKQPFTLVGRASADAVQVRVSVGRKTGKLCRFLRSDGTFSPARSCLRTSYLTATGARSWKIKLPATLPKGQYLIWSRALSETKIEAKFSSRNLLRLTVK